MSASGPASARRATLDAIALAFAFLAVDGLVVAAALADLVEWTQAIVTVLALGAVVLLLFRDDVMDAIAAGNEKLGLSADGGVRLALEALGKEWTVEHDVVRGAGGSTTWWWDLAAHSSSSPATAHTGWSTWAAPATTPRACTASWIAG